MDILSFYDEDVAVAMYHFISEKDNYNEFCKQDMSIAYWIRKYKLKEFDKYCEKTFNFRILEILKNEYVKRNRISKKL